MAHPIQAAPATPTAIPWPPGLTLKFGDIVRLTGNNMGPNFPPGTIVYITTWCDTVVSPQVQRADWVRTDANVLYGFAKKIPVQEILWYTGPDNGRAGAPNHEQLTLRPDPESKQPTYYALGSRLYLQKETTVSYRPNPNARAVSLKAQPGTRCFVTKIVTRIDSSTPVGSSDSARSAKRAYYTILVKVSIYHWEEVRQPLRKEIGNFERILPNENQGHYYSAGKLPDGGNARILSVTDTDEYAESRY